ncbi:MAG: hypothetical protein GWO10_17175, partial [candidate division Zixibacteria bacterium]|nr:hypothetical protein [candidate division Zixibacteria bacterium]NIW46546.1 hypothetical protein [Gammaproteobacteria bacterium]
GSYLKHSNDIETATILQPIIRKSISMILLNKGDDNLMYASRPDWWDIGHVYGARAYITALTIRALRMYVYLNLKLGLTDHDLNPYLALVRKMQTQLGERLWDAEAGFLLNMLDSTKVDRHYYAGSLIAAVFDLLEEEKQRTLLETAERKLLDSQIGTRIVMPADFHRLINVYKFKGMEAGEPYVYINGGVWPQGIVWYALGWLSLGRPDKARAIIEKYYTLQGIQNSPNGQPSFFEYRNANAESPHYGEIDKPTFLWAAGWYLHTLYHLAGLRENEWNIAVASHLPSAWQQVNYDILIGGKPVRVSYSGTGKYFKRIEIDGKSSSSAVIDSGSDQIILERGHPETPYLVKANCQIKGVQFSKSNRILRIEARGMLGQPVNLQVISPLKPQGLFVNNRTTHNHFQTHQNDNVWIVIIESSLQELEEIFEIAF